MVSLRQPQGTKAWCLARGLSRPIAAPALSPDPHVPARRRPEDPASVQRSREQGKRGPGLPPQRSQQQPRGAGGGGLWSRKLHSLNLSLTEQRPPGQVDSSLCPVRTCSVTLGTSLSLCRPQQPRGPYSAPSRMAMSSRRLSGPSSEAVPSQSRHNYTTPSPPTAPVRPELHSQRACLGSRPQRARKDRHWPRGAGVADVARSTALGPVSGWHTATTLGP